MPPLSRAVRRGRAPRCTAGGHAPRRRVAQEHGATFAADKTANLVARLRHNVIRAGLRRINLAYSRISLEDVAAKLGARRAGRAARGAACWPACRPAGPDMGSALYRKPVESLQRGGVKFGHCGGRSKDDPFFG